MSSGYFPLPDTADISRLVFFSLSLNWRWSLNCSTTKAWEPLPLPVVWCRRGLPLLPANGSSDKSARKKSKSQTGKERTWTGERRSTGLHSEEEFKTLHLWNWAKGIAFCGPSRGHGLASHWTHVLPGCGGEGEGECSCSLARSLAARCGRHSHSTVRASVCLLCWPRKKGVGGNRRAGEEPLSFRISRLSTERTKRPPTGRQSD